MKVIGIWSLILSAGLSFLAPAWAEDLLTLCPAQQPSSVPCATHPTPKQYILPQYTDEARRAGTEGPLVLSLRITKKGEPRDILIVKSLDMALDERAMAALKQWKFSPAIYQNHPVPVNARLEFYFSNCKAYGTASEVPAPGSGYSQARAASNQPLRECNRKRVTKGTCAPLIVKRTLPPLPPEPQSAPEGSVALSFDITDHGLPDNIRVIKSAAPDLDNEAVATVRQWVFRPALKKGWPIPARTTAEIRFGRVRRLGCRPVCSRSALECDARTSTTSGYFGENRVCAFCREVKTRDA